MGMQVVPPPFDFIVQFGETIDDEHQDCSSASHAPALPGVREAALEL
jgi:hypothetical protein